MEEIENIEIPSIDDRNDELIAAEIFAGNEKNAASDSANADVIDEREILRQKEIQIAIKRREFCTICQKKFVSASNLDRHIKGYVT